MPTMIEPKYERIEYSVPMNEVDHMEIEGWGVVAFILFVLLCSFRILYRATKSPPAIDSDVMIDQTW